MAARPHYAVDEALTATLTMWDGYHDQNGKKVKPDVHDHFETWHCAHIETWMPHCWPGDIDRRLDMDSDYVCVFIALYCRLDVSTGRVWFLEAKSRFNKATGMIKTLTWFDETAAQAKYTSDWKSFRTQSMTDIMTLVSSITLHIDWLADDKKSINIDAIRNMAQHANWQYNTHTVRGPRLADYSV